MEIEILISHFIFYKDTTPFIYNKNFDVLVMFPQKDPKLILFFFGKISKRNSYNFIFKQKIVKHMFLIGKNKFLNKPQIVNLNPLVQRVTKPTRPELTRNLWVLVDYNRVWIEFVLIRLINELFSCQPV